MTILFDINDYVGMGLVLHAIMKYASRSKSDEVKDMDEISIWPISWGYKYRYLIDILSISVKAIFTHH